MRSIRFGLSLALLFGASAFSQDFPMPPPPPGAHAIEMFGVPGKDVSFIRAEFNLEGKVVKGAPYSAQATTEFTQTLPDGNHISRTTTALVARDSEGRTRREQSFAAVGPWAGSGDAMKSVIIHDPVAQVSYVYEAGSQSKVARSMPDMKPPAAGETTTVVRTNATGTEQVHSAVRVLHKQLMEGKKDTLGTQMIEGVQAEGTRTTRTIPAGQIGNERAIDIVTESWYSADLQTVVMSRTSDPRSGETVYKLGKIDRSEPAAALFAVPSDYTVQENKGQNHTFTFRQHHQ
jgi:hypothetical protein